MESVVGVFKHGHTTVVFWCPSKCVMDLLAQCSERDIAQAQERKEVFIDPFLTGIGSGTHLHAQLDSRRSALARRRPSAARTLARAAFAFAGNTFALPPGLLSCSLAPRGGRQKMTTPEGSNATRRRVRLSTHPWTAV